jgi:hypothetical protein
VIVAGYKDLLAVKPRPVVLVEHGAGQTYGAGTPAHPGGRNRETVKLFICPSEQVAEKNRARYDVPAVAVGAPTMDRFHRHPRKPEKGVVAVAFHWNALTAPEARTAFPYFRDSIAALSRERTVIGHGHPRVAESLRQFYAGVGIPWASLDEVYERAEVLVVDNSSVGWEFLSLDRPVVWLNAPWYRREVSYGMRFWELADSGVQVDQPEDLSFAITAALMDPPQQQRKRREAVAQVYVSTDGHAAERAARAIEEWHDASTPTLRRWDLTRD